MSNTGQITSEFYLAIDTKDRSMFRRVLLLSSLVTFFTAVVWNVTSSCNCNCAFSVKVLQPLSVEYYMFVGGD